MCYRCEEHTLLKKYWCGDCREVLEKNDDFHIGPIDREGGICALCFGAKERFCGCGNPSYDPDASRDDLDDDSDESDEFCYIGILLRRR